MRRQRQFKANARGGAGQGGGNRLAALVGLGVHARAFNLAQQVMHAHRAFKQTLGRIVARVLFHLGEQVQVHATGKGAFLARGNDDALDGVIGQRGVNQRVQLAKAVNGHDVHGFACDIPSDDGNAVGVCFQCEIGHCYLPDLGLFEGRRDS